MPNDGMWRDIVQFNDRFFPKWRETELIFLSNALAGEVGEICNDIKHLYGGGTNKRKPTKAELMEEASDIFIYLVLLSEVLGFDYEGFVHSLERKLWKNHERMNGQRED